MCSFCFPEDGTNHKDGTHQRGCTCELHVLHTYIISHNVFYWKIQFGPRPRHISIGGWFWSIIVKVTSNQARTIFHGLVAVRRTASGAPFCRFYRVRPLKGKPCLKHRPVMNIVALTTCTLLRCAKRCARPSNQDLDTYTWEWCCSKPVRLRFCRSDGGVSLMAGLNLRSLETSSCPR